MRKILLMLFWGISGFLFAHPHVFVIVDVEMIFSDSLFEKIKVKWVMDDMTSAMIYEDFDLNANNVFEDTETAKLATSFQDMQADSDYKLMLWHQDKRLTIKEITSFNVVSQDIYVIYEFEVIFNEKLLPRGNVKMSTYDIDNMIKLTLDENVDFKITSPPTLTQEWKKYLNKNTSFYFGQLHPYEFSIDYRRN